jgi:hypothetical protein
VHATADGGESPGGPPQAVAVKANIAVASEPPATLTRLRMAEWFDLLLMT